MFHMTFKQAIDYAQKAATTRGYRYRVYKSRAVVGWWNTFETDIKVPAANTRRP